MSWVVHIRRRRSFPPYVSSSGVGSDDLAKEVGKQISISACRLRCTEDGQTRTTAMFPKVVARRILHGEDPKVQ